MSASEASTALVRRASSDVTLMPPPPTKKIKRPGIPLGEDDYTSTLSDIIARDYFPGLREGQVQQEYLTALDSGNEAWIAEAGQKLREATGSKKTARSARDARFDRRAGHAPTPRTPKHAADTPLGDNGCETPSTIATEVQAQDKPTASAPIDTSRLSLSSFQAIYTSEDNASFNNVLDKQNAVRRGKHAYLWTADQRLLSKRQVLHRAKEQKLLIEKSESVAAAEKHGDTQVIPVSVGADGSRPAKPEGWKSKGPANNLLFHPDSIDETGLTTVAEEKERMSKAGPKTVVHQNTRFPPLHVLQQDRDRVKVPASPSLNTDILRQREGNEYAGGETPRVNGYAFVDEDEPTATSPASKPGPSYRDLLAGQAADGTPNPFRLSAAQKREALHYRMVEETNRKKRLKQEETMKTPLRLDGARTPRATRGAEFANMTPAARKLMEKLERTPVNVRAEGMASKEIWTPARTPRRKAIK